MYFNGEKENALTAVRIGILVEEIEIRRTGSEGRFGVLQSSIEINSDEVGDVNKWRIPSAGVDTALKDDQ